MEANTFITKWEYRYEANLSIDAINEIGSQGWELIKVWDCTYLFKRMVLEEWNLDGYKAAAFKPVKQEEPANIEPKPFVTEAGKWYMCIKDRQYWSNIELMFTKGKVYKSPKDGYLTDNHGDCTCPFLEPSFLYQDYFRPATAEEIVKAEAHKAGYDFKMESDNKESEDEKIRKEIDKRWIAWLEKQGEQKPAWSEEDEIRYLSIMSVLLSTIGTDKTSFTVTREIGWLKSLKDRLVPQPKQEWSEEDINMIDWFIRCCEEEHKKLCNDRYGHQEIVSDLKRDCRKKWDWLESLKNKVAPQSHLKPSEKQIKALEGVINYYQCNVGYDEANETLKDLLQQLKAL